MIPPLPSGRGSVEPPRKSRVLCGNCSNWYNSPEQDAKHGVGICGFEPSRHRVERGAAVSSSPPLAPVYAHVCHIPDKHGNQQQCEACEHDERLASPSPETPTTATTPGCTQYIASAVFRAEEAERLAWERQHIIATAPNIEAHLRAQVKSLRADRDRKAAEVEALASGKVWRLKQHENPKILGWYAAGYEAPFATHTAALAALLGGPDPEPRIDNG